MQVPPTVFYCYIPSFPRGIQGVRFLQPLPHVIPPTPVILRKSPGTVSDPSFSQRIAVLLAPTFREYGFGTVFALCQVRRLFAQ